MRTIYYILILLFWALFLASCGSDKADKRIEISGTLYNNKADTVQLYRVKHGSFEVWKSTAIDSIKPNTGRFSFKEEVSPGFYNIRAVNHSKSFYASGSDEIEFQVRDKQLTFKDTTAQNKVMEEWQALFSPITENTAKKLYGQQGNFEETSAAIANFLEKATSFTQKINTGNDHFDRLFPLYVRSKIESVLFHSLFFRFGVKMGIDNFPPFYTQLGEMEKFERADALNLPNGYRWLMFSVQYHTIKDSLSNLSPKKILPKKVALIPNDTLKGLYISKNYKQFRQYGADFTEMMNLLRQYLVLDAYKEPIAKYEDKYRYLSSGKKGLNFSGVTKEGNVVEFDDLQGQYLYIDFWASWCQPCIAQFPHLKKLKKEFEDKNIKFVGVSLDTRDAKGAWKQKIEEHQLNGTQLHVEEAFNSKLAEYYRIDAIPRFMIFDPDGNIVSVDTVRPSHKQIRDRLSRLLN